MNFGEINQFILFGGGQLLSVIAQQLKGKGFSVLVVTSKRHSLETITTNSLSTSLLDFLRDHHVNHVISNDASVDVNIIDQITKKTMGISFGAAWIFKKNFIDLFHGRLLNLHGARLPQDRGGGGFSWRILRGEKIGVSLIHQIDAGIDTGDIIFFEEYIYPSSCRIPLDYQRYSTEKNQVFLNRFFDLVKAQKPFVKTPQQDCFSSYWPRLSTDVQGYIDWSWNLGDIEKFICAFDDPYNGAITYINNNKIRLKQCYSSCSDGIFHPFQRGVIYRISKTTIFVAVDQGTLLINNVLDEAGIDIKKKLRIGDRFYTPMMLLEKAKQFRAIYTPESFKNHERK